MMTKKTYGILEALYLRGELSLTELSDAIGSSPSATSNLLNKIYVYEPPMIEKRKERKYSFYSLTEEGKRYYESHMDEKGSLKGLTNPYLNHILISYILDHIDPENSDLLIQGLKNLGTDRIEDIFNIREFMFLSLILGIISDPKSVEEAVSLAMPEIKKENCYKIGRSIFNKLKVNLFDSYEKSILTYEKDIFDRSNLKL